MVDYQACSVATWSLAIPGADGISSQSATADEVLDAAKAAFVDRFVHSLPDVCATTVDDDSGTLSARGRQLITTARTIVARPSDLILVRGHGAIVEQGNHAELLAIGGAHAKLYDAQFAAPLDEVDAPIEEVHVAAGPVALDAVDIPDPSLPPDAGENTV